MTLLGAAHLQLAALHEALPVLRDALGAAVQLEDRALEASVRERLGQALREQGAWPEALGEFERSRGLLGSRGAEEQIEAAELNAWLGRGEDAERVLHDTARSLGQSSDRRALFDLRVAQARLAYAEGRMTEAATRSRQALTLRPDDASPSLVQALVRIRSGKFAEGAAAAEAAIARYEQAKVIFEAAAGRLAAAQALALAAGPAWHREALKFALENLRFTEPRKIWESVWRAHAVASQTAEPAAVHSHGVGAAAALAQLKMQWSPVAFDAYMRRAEIQRMAKSVM